MSRNNPLKNMAWLKHIRDNGDGYEVRVKTGAYKQDWVMSDLMSSLVTEERIYGSSVLRVTKDADGKDTWQTRCGKGVISEDRDKELVRILMDKDEEL